MVVVLTSPKMLPQTLVWTLNWQVIPVVDVVKLLQLTWVESLKIHLPQFTDKKLYLREGQLYSILSQLKIISWTFFLGITATIMSGGGGCAEFEQNNIIDNGKSYAVNNKCFQTAWLMLELKSYVVS